ncbi:hypothetical protein D3C81_1768170 [compost metagenome]
MRHHPRRDRAKAFPQQFPLQLLPHGGAYITAHHHQRPAAIPLLRFARIDALAGVQYPLQAGFRQPVVAAPPDLVRGEPVVCSQSESGRAHQPVIDAERRREADQAPQPHRLRPRRHHVAVQRHQQGIGAQLEAARQPGDARGGLFRVRGSRHRGPG